MKITSIRTRFERFDLSRPYAISFRPMMGEVENGIVEIGTSDGSTGYGCASPEPYVTKETPEACRHALSESELAWLVGRDVRELQSLCRALAERTERAPAAQAAIDMALHDLLAQQLHIPLVELLGRAHDRLPTSITIGIKPLDETLAEADEYLGRGFRILKVKLGESLEQDLERLHRLRERVGDRVLIRVDPNQGYDAETLLAFVAASEKLDIEFIEQPTPAADIDALRALPAAVRRRVAADESLLDEADALGLLAPPGACGIFNIKLMKCGGVRPAMRIAAIAETAGIKLMWGCMDESIISISAALHAALASPATRYLDLDGSLDLARDVVEGGFILEGGYMSTTQHPGLGVRPVG